MRRRDGHDPTAGVPPELLEFRLGDWSTWPAELLDEDELARAVWAWTDARRDHLAAGGALPLDLVDVARQGIAVRRRMAAALRRDLPPRRP